MVTKLYAEPLPYGAWALSMALLLGAFFWFKSDELEGHIYTSRTGKHRWDDDQEEGDSDAEGEDESTWAENREEGHPSWGHTSSSAYQTDEEVGLEQAAGWIFIFMSRTPGRSPTTVVIAGTVTRL